MDIQKNHTIAEFCEIERISKVHYFALRKRGEGPDEVRAGRRVSITPESRRAWEKRQTKRFAEAEATAA